MDFGMPTFVEFDSLEKNCVLCKKLHLDFVEINMNFPEYQVDFLDASFCRKIMNDYGIYFTIHLGENLDLADANPKIRKSWNETVFETIELAKKIGAPVINMHLNHGVYVTLPEKKIFIHEERYADYKKYFDEFKKKCEKKIGSCKIKICIENTDGFLPFEKKLLDSLLESKVFSLTWDVGHGISSGEKDMEFMLSKISRLSHFHIHDGTRPSHGGKCHLPLGTGEINLESRLELAKECNARCVIETKNSALLERSIKWLETKGFENCP